jgi:hypothetical protein
MLTRVRNAGFAVGTTLALVGCSSGTGPAGGRQITLSIAGTALNASAAPGAAAAESVTVAGHTLVLDHVSLVLRKIELKRVESTVCSDDDSTSSGPAASDGSGEGEHSGDDGCEEIAVGPLLVDLPLGGEVERVLSVPVDSGTFRGVEFKIHQLESTPADQDLLAAHPELMGVSVMATGTFDGQAFTFTSDVTAKQESSLDPPLVVADGVDANLTLKVDVGAWFTVNGGLVDPAQAASGQPLASVVRDNIRRSFRLFEDHDHDGKDDH